VVKSFFGIHDKGECEVLFGGSAGKVLAGT